MEGVTKSREAKSPDKARNESLRTEEKQRNANSLANLKRFQPGQSGNPGGRPKKKPVTEAYERIISDPKVAQAIAQGIIRAARKGNVRAAAEIADRVEGKVSQDVNLNVVDYRKIAEEARKRVEDGNG